MSSARKRLFGRKQWVIVTIVTVLIIGSAVGSWLYISAKNSASIQAQLSADQAVTKAETQRAQAASQTQAEADKLVYEGKPKEAIAIYDQAIKQTNDSYQQSILLLDKANLLMNNNDLDGALVIAKQAELINQNSAVTAYIAQVYENKSDSAKAIEYYKKTIPLVDKSKPLAVSDIQYYQSRIEALGGAKG